MPPEEAADDVVGAVGELEAVEERSGAAGAFAGGQAEIGAVKEQDLAGGEGEIEVGTLRHHADEALGGDLFLPDVVGADPGLAGGGRTRVVRMPTVVDLPAPWGPAGRKTSPARTSREMPSRATISDFGPARRAAKKPRPAACGGDGRRRMVGLRRPRVRRPVMGITWDTVTA